METEQLLVIILGALAAFILIFFALSYRIRLINHNDAEGRITRLFKGTALFFIIPILTVPVVFGIFGLSYVYYNYTHAAGSSAVRPVSSCISHYEKQSYSCKSDYDCVLVGTAFFAPRVTNVQNAQEYYSCLRVNGDYKGLMRHPSPIVLSKGIAAKCNKGVCLAVSASDKQMKLELMLENAR